MKKAVLFLSLGFLCPLFTWAQTQALNAGFVSGIWYSQAPFFAGETVRIYTAIQNQSGFDILGKVQFLDSGTVLGASDFSAINGRLIEKWLDWKVTEGNHGISVRIVEAKKSVVGKLLESVTLRFQGTVADTQFADLDTDGDRIGNREDPDDDNDGIPDGTEITKKTDPLKSDTDGDGVSDARDLKPLDRSVSSSAETQKSAVAPAPTSPGAPVSSPEPASEQGLAGRAVERINEFADTQKKKIDVKRRDLRETLAAGGTELDSPDESTVPSQDARPEAGARVRIEKSPVQYLSLAMLAAASFALGNRVAFYSLLALAGFLVLRLAFRLLRQREYEE